jgi:uncharacterized lipoprotein YddW (UPF0748 family)
MRTIPVCWLLLTVPGLADYRPVQMDVPPPAREFRAAWVASVWNVDWPSKPGLPPETQRREMARILDVAAQTNLNAIILQVRPEADALYPSKLEPWSYWLTGEQGAAPSDGYDPLAFAVREAHARGMELHAWFNPFRARSTSEVKPAASHALRRQPSWLMPAGTQTWLNPGLPAVRGRAIEVMTDVAKRYDIDGVHIDDYFYPYPKSTGSGNKAVFDDSATYEAYRSKGGKLTIQDWRRAQVDGFVKELGGAIRKVRPGLKFGVSPFGIWRPGNPASIEAGIDSYRDLSADSRLWLREGWVDYLTPQLYWRIDQDKQSFETLVKWWNEQNVSGRHLWPGIASSRIRADGSDKARRALESVNQIAMTRRYASAGGGPGHSHWSVSSLIQDRDGIRAKLKSGPYKEVALIPESAWLASRGSVGVPAISAVAEGDAVRVQWQDGKETAGVRWWIVQTKGTDSWPIAKVLPKGITTAVLKGTPSVLAVRSVDAAGRVSAAACLQRGR